MQEGKTKPRGASENANEQRLKKHKLNQQLITQLFAGEERASQEKALASLIGANE